jgi:transcriptional regulator with XRE-family HTH domain
MQMWFEDRNELATRRKSLGLSQAKLGALAGISRSVVRDVERGRIKLRGDRAQRLWKAVCDGMRKREQCSNALAARFRGELLHVPGEITVSAAELFELSRELAQQRQQLADLRTLLAEIAERVDSLHEETQAATADEGTRILEENRAHEDATK